MYPIDVKKVEDNKLAIIWDDGHQSIYAMDLLRKRCPCAGCRTAREAKQNNALRILSSGEVVSRNIEIKEAEFVGRYALQFRWSDGHHEGIYSFDFLRQLCQCDRCDENRFISK